MYIVCTLYMLINWVCLLTRIYKISFQRKSVLIYKKTTRETICLGNCSCLNGAFVFFLNFNPAQKGWAESESQYRYFVVYYLYILFIFRMIHQTHLLQCVLEFPAAEANRKQFAFIKFWHKYRIVCHSLTSAHINTIKLRISPFWIACSFGSTAFPIYWFG